MQARQRWIGLCEVTAVKRKECCHGGGGLCQNARSRLQQQAMLSLAIFLSLNYLLLVVFTLNRCYNVCAPRHGATQRQDKLTMLF